MAKNELVIDECVKVARIICKRHGIPVPTAPIVGQVHGGAIRGFTRSAGYWRRRHHPFGHHNRTAKSCAGRQKNSAA